MGFRGQLRVITLATACLALLCQTSALADVRRGNGEIGFDLGGTGYASSLADSGAFRADFRIGYHATSVFQIEALAGVSDNSDVTMENLLVNAVFNFHPSFNLVPYLLIGGGAARVDVGGTDDTDVAYQAAVGSRFFGRGGKTGIRTELGWLREETFGQGKSHWNLTIGLTWRLGAERTVIRARPDQRKSGPMYGW